MKIINKSKFKIFKNLIKINNNYFKNIKIVFESFYNKIFFKWILICHALTSSHHFLGIYLNNLKNIGWWNQIINEKLLTLKLNFICINNLNSSYGTTNNYTYNPLINKIYSNKFPKIKLKDWIILQYFLIKKINIKKIFIIIGGSLGGMQVILWSIIYPKLSNNYCCIASTNKMSKINFIKNKINKLFINYKKNIFNKYYFTYNIKSIKSLKILRIVGHLSYLSNYDLKKKSFKNFFLKNYKIFNKKYKISEYFFYKSNNFYKIFNINSYLYIINLLNKFNIKFLNNNYLNYLIIFFNSDKRFYVKNSKNLIKILLNKKNKINFKIINNKSGHDSFLIKNLLYNNILELYINYISER